MKKQEQQNADPQLTFEAVSDTETKAIVLRDGERFEIRVLHASPDDIEEFKKFKEEFFSKRENNEVLV